MLTITYPDDALIPSTEYTIRLVFAEEFRMTVHTGDLVILDRNNDPYIDLSNWNAYEGVRAANFFKQSQENPNIIFIDCLVPEYYRKRDIKQYSIHTLKINLPMRSFRVCEKGESKTDIDRQFYPVNELPKIKKILETHLHSKKSKNNSKF